jgi:hypothetical protein
MAIILDGTNGETFPSWTTVGRPASPATGQTGYNTTLNILETYNGSAWVVSSIPTPTTTGNILFTTDGTNWTSTSKIGSSGPQSMIGTDAVTYASIPSWAKRITVITQGSSGIPGIRLGTSSGIVSTNYVSAYYSALAANNTSSGSTTTSFFTQANDGTFILYSLGSNTWSYVSSHTNSGNRATTGSGYITGTNLGGVLTQIQLIGTFTTGTIQFLYE